MTMARNVNTTDRTLLRRQEEHEARLEKRRLDDISWIMSDERGRRVMYDEIFIRCGLMDVYQGQDSGVYRHEGKREIGQTRASELQRLHPELYMQMIREQMAEQQLNNLRAEEPAPGDLDG